MDWYLTAAAVVSLFTCGVHAFLGGPATVGPLLASEDIDPVAKYTNYYCWHIVTAVLLAMPAGFAAAAYWPDSWELAVMMTALSGAFLLWNIILIVWKYREPWKMPQWTLFAPITALGVLGLLL